MTDRCNTLQRVIDRLDLVIAEAIAWNDLNPDRTPVDIEPARLMRHKAVRMLAAVKGGGDIPDTWFEEFERLLDEADLAAARMREGSADK